MIIYQIRPPKAQDVEAFVRFMCEEYFPAVHKGLTRVDEVENLRLPERSNLLEGDDVTHEFFLHVGLGGPRTGEEVLWVDDETVGCRLKALGAEMKHLGYYGYYEGVTAWSPGDPVQLRRRAATSKRKPNEPENTLGRAPLQV